MTLAAPGDVLDFWFAPPGSREHGQQRRCWFVKDPAFDQEIRRRFLPTWEAAAGGALDHWRGAPAPMLALIVVLDQFPRNLFRGEARAFSSDARALACAEEAVARGFDQQLAPVQRIFVYLPFEHSEDAGAQARSVELFSALAAAHEGFAETLRYALRHRDIVARFGRFPHRNAILGRASSAEEMEFLRQPGSGF
ncbi:MAG: DUF924 family protein [Pseudomonadota bacterium]